MNKFNNKELSRRNFLKVMRATGIATVGMTGFIGKTDDIFAGNMPEKIPTGKMTYRTSPKSGF
jgi:hypothetical protein